MLKVVNEPQWEKVQENAGKRRRGVLTEAWVPTASSPLELRGRSLGFSAKETHGVVSLFRL